MMKKLIMLTALLLLAALVFPSCGASNDKDITAEYSVGFSKQVLEYGDMSDYYIAGYKNGNHPEGVLDPQYVKAVWIDNGKASVLLIVVDCIGLDSGSVAKIRKELKRLECDSVNVISTHTHAGVDTLGLWGPIGINGKNEEFNLQITEKAVAAAHEAYEARCTGKLLYSETETDGLQTDSREPSIYDKNIYQLRFVPNGKKEGVRIVSFAAHAESLRGDNKLISADFPSELARLAKEESSDEMIFLPGAIGGLVMTPLFDGEDTQRNMRLTAEKLWAYLKTAEESELEARLDVVRVEFETKLDNTLFIYYKFLGILGNDAQRGLFGGYTVKSELTLLRLGEVTLSLLPGEIFPELISGPGSDEGCEPLASIAKRYGVEKTVFVGLANDELGYIVTPSDFVLDADAPYVNSSKGHYEETNSVGINVARDIAKAYKKAAEKLQKQQ